ncbi:hypothetical protein CF166_00150 [Amycolatopsis sp. KNN50.9b]|nr:hypothetical protein CF166_00150 [Amycolatopsis sp. KNN50.9b]
MALPALRLHHVVAAAGLRCLLRTDGHFHELVEVVAVCRAGDDADGDGAGARVAAESRAFGGSVQKLLSTVDEQ